MDGEAPLDFLISPDDAPSKQEILRVALDLFVRDGLCATSLRDISAASGYSSTVLYKFFESKDELAAYLFERCYRLLATRLRNRIDPGLPFSANMHFLMQSAGQLLSQHAQAVLYVSEHIRLMWPSMSAPMRQGSLVCILTELFAQGVREGAIENESEIPYLVTVFMGSLSQYAKLLYFKEFAVVPEEGVMVISEILERVFKKSVHE